MPIASPLARTRRPRTVESCQASCQATRSCRAPRQSRQALLIAAALLPLVGCATPALQLPSELAPADRLEVDGMRWWGTPKELRFGPYRATGIDRGFTRGSGWGVGAVQNDEAHQRYQYRLSEGEAEQGAVSCESRAERRSLDLRVVALDSGADVDLTCSLTAGDPLHGWTLSLASRRDRHLEGQLYTPDRRFEVRGTGRGGKIAPAETHGFHLLSDGRVVAAVQTIGRGTVWLAPELGPEDRRIVALGAVALLLYQEPPTD